MKKLFVVTLVALCLVGAGFAKGKAAKSAVVTPSAVVTENVKVKAVKVKKAAKKVVVAPTATAPVKK